MWCRLKERKRKVNGEATRGRYRVKRERQKKKRRRIPENEEEAFIEGDMENTEEDIGTSL